MSKTIDNTVPAYIPTTTDGNGGQVEQIVKWPVIGQEVQHNNGKIGTVLEVKERNVFVDWGLYESWVNFWLINDVDT